MLCLVHSLLVKSVSVDLIQLAALIFNGLYKPGTTSLYRLISISKSSLVSLCRNLGGAGRLDLFDEECDWQEEKQDGAHYPHTHPRPPSSLSDPHQAGLLDPDEDTDEDVRTESDDDDDDSESDDEDESSSIEDENDCDSSSCDSLHRLASGLPGPPKGPFAAGLPCGTSLGLPSPSSLRLSACPNQLSYCKYINRVNN